MPKVGNFLSAMSGEKDKQTFSRDFIMAFFKKCVFFTACVVF